MANKFTYYGIDYPLPITEELKQHIASCENSGKYKLYVHVVHEERDKYYVGVTKNTLAKRWARGRGYPGAVFQAAIEKHGWDNIDHVALSQSLSEEDAYKLEKLTIKELNSASAECGYNIAFGGKGVAGVQLFGDKNHFYGRKHSTESRDLIRLHHADCNKEKNAFYGKKHSLESRKKMSESHKGRYCGAENFASRKVINLETGIVFDTLKDACKYAGSGHVIDVCRGHRQYAGKDKSGRRLSWRYA